MTTSGYSIPVQAATPKDAEDIAKRIARDEGWRVRTVRRTLRVGPTTGTMARYVVDLAVDRP